MAKDLPNATTYESKNEVMRVSDRKPDQLQYINKEQEQSLSQLELEVMRTPQEDDNPLEKWDDKNITPEYLKECRDYYDKLDNSKESNDKKREFVEKMSQYFKESSGRYDESIEDYKRVQIPDGVIDGTEKKAEYSLNKQFNQYIQALNSYLDDTLEQKRSPGSLSLYAHMADLGNDLINAGVHSADSKPKADEDVGDGNEQYRQNEVKQVDDNAAAIEAQEQPKIEEKPKGSRLDSIMAEMNAKYEQQSADYEARNENTHSYLESHTLEAKYS